MRVCEVRTSEKKGEEGGRGWAMFVLFAASFIMSRHWSAVNAAHHQV